MNYLNIDSAVLCVKTIVDANRCFTCDQLNVSNVRYSCGHSICKNCLVKQEYCLLCVTPPKPCPHLFDESLNQRVLHASELVTAFQDVFNVDVNRRSRISDKLKKEKLLFPKCIQAPAKYANKRKSLNTSNRSEDISRAVSTFPGENIYRSSSNMENKIDYINQWLNNNDINRKKSIRKPLEDLNVNHLRLTNKPKTKIPHNIKNTSKSKKRTHAETSLSERNIKQLASKKIKKKIGSEIITLANNVNLNTVQENLDQNESGIVKNDEIDFIDNSQSKCIDNNKNKCTTTIEATLNNNTTTFFNDNLYNRKMIPLNTTSDNHKLTNKCAVNGCIHKVAFFRRSSLIETCRLCNEFNTCINKKKSLSNVTITIDNKAFVTSINFTNCVQKKTGTLRRKSVAVQTDITNILDLNNKDLSVKLMLTRNNTNYVTNPNTAQVDTSLQNNNFAEGNIKNIDSPEKPIEVNIAEKGPCNNESVISPKCVVIEDSDVSETDSGECSDGQSVMEVSADVHRSCSLIDYEVLNTLHSHEYEHRNRHAAREHTPVSTDSSDKENYDPNRSRRTKNRGKKCDSKK